VPVHDQPVGTGKAVGELLELAVGGVAVDAAGRVGEIGDALVGEVEISFKIECEVVHAFEGLLVVARHYRHRLAVLEMKDAVLVVGDEQPAVLVHGEAVRLAVVFDDGFKLSCLIDLEDATPGEIHHVQVARAVEHRPFEERAHRRGALARGEALGRRAALAQARRDFREDFSFYRFHSTLIPASRTSFANASASDFT
jgi:hypothetical protein